MVSPGREVASLLAFLAACSSGDSVRSGAAAGPDDPASSGSARPAAPDVRAAAVGSLLAAIRDTLRARNPEVDRVGLVELRTASYDYGPAVALAYGIRTGEFRDRFDDELFGLFVVDDSLTRVIRTIAVLPTRRWRDYVVHIAELSADSVRIEGAGASFGDQGIRRSYALASPDSAPPPA